MTPYEILGLKEGVAQEEVTERYNILIRKIKEVDLSGSPLEKDRNHRMQQLRAAYDEIIYSIPMPEYLLEPLIQENQLIQVPLSPIENVESLLDQNRYEEAIQVLNTITEQTAYWNFLYGVAQHDKGMIQDSITKLRLAVAMEPDNQTYIEVYNQAQAEINKTIQDAKNQRNAEVAGGAVLVGTGLCATCLCDSCCNS